MPLCRQKQKEFSSEVSLEIKGSNSEPKCQTGPIKKKRDCCSGAVLSYIAYVCFNFKLSVSPRFVTQTYGTGITFYLVFIESAVAAQAVQKCHNVNNIYY